MSERSDSHDDVVRHPVTRCCTAAKPGARRRKRNREPGPKATYGELLKDPRWQRKRLEIMERDDWTCRDTGKHTESLQVHHCWYNGRNPWDTPEEYLLTLTEDAHQRRQEIEGRGKRAIGGIFASLSPAELEKFVRQLEEARYNADTQGGESPVVMGIGLFNWTADEAWWEVLEPEIGRDRLREITGTVEVTKAEGPSDG